MKNAQMISGGVENLLCIGGILIIFIPLLILWVALYTATDEYEERREAKQTKKDKEKNNE